LDDQWTSGGSEIFRCPRLALGALIHAGRQYLFLTRLINITDSAMAWSTRDPTPFLPSNKVTRETLLKKHLSSILLSVRISSISDFRDAHARQGYVISRVFNEARNREETEFSGPQADSDENDDPSYRRLLSFSFFFLLCNKDFCDDFEEL
jgi:hypothetical protein